MYHDDASRLCDRNRSQIDLPLEGIGGATRGEEGTDRMWVKKVRGQRRKDHFPQETPNSNR